MRRSGTCHPESFAHQLLESGRFWRGYLFEHVRVPPAGVLERVATPSHRIFFVASGNCDVRYRAAFGETKCRLSRGAFCFVSRGYEFDRVSWKASRCEVIAVDIDDIGADPNPIDAFGRTDAFFDLYMGIEDARVATLLDLMRAEIESGCPTGSAYADLPGQCGTASNTFNTSTFSTVSTTRLRLNVTAKTGLSTGVLEWQAFAV